MKFLADILAAIGGATAAAGTQGCWVFICDEPKMPKSMLEK